MTKKILVSLLMLFCLVPAVVVAQDGEQSTPEVNTDAVVDSLELENVPQTQADETTLASALSAVFTIAGALSVVFIIIGGFKMVLSAGDPNGVGTARRTILYAVIGLVVSLSAFVIVRFVLGRL